MGQRAAAVALARSAELLVHDEPHQAGGQEDRRRGAIKRDAVAAGHVGQEYPGIAEGQIGHVAAARDDLDPAEGGAAVMQTFLTALGVRQQELAEKASRSHEKMITWLPNDANGSLLDHLNKAKDDAGKAAKLLHEGAIAAGASLQTVVTFPSNVGVSGAPSTLTVSGSYAGANFGTSARITLP